MSKNIQISSLHESPFNYNDVVFLLHSSFEERLDQGLKFTCSSMTANDLLERTRNGIVLVAWTSDNNMLLGTVTITIKTNKYGIKYGYHENLAVNPKTKRMGIGRLLFSEVIDIASSSECQYIISDTAVNADSSVRWHINNGFKIIALRSFPSTNYYSYIFRKQLTSSNIWNNDFYIWIRYHISYVFIKALYNEDGSYSFWGKLLRPIIKR